MPINYVVRKKKDQSGNEVKERAQCHSEQRSQ